MKQELCNLAEKYFSLEGKRGIVTGGSAGIGKAIALTLAQAGAEVFVFSRSGKFKDDTSASNVFHIMADVSNTEKCRDGSIYITRAEADVKLDFIPLYSFSGFEILSHGYSLKVIDVEPAAANPLLLVEKNGVRFHVPVIMVMNEGLINWEKKVIELDLPDGLEDLTP